MRVWVLLFVVGCSADLAVRSAESYDDNERGLIGAAKLRSWLRAPPSGGDLIILQWGGTATIPSSPGVRSYVANELVFMTEPRNNGLVAIGAVPSNGIRIDSFMRRFNIRPNVDFVLFVGADGNLDTVSRLARAWLTFRYWGFDDRVLGILDGPVPSDLLSSEITPHPFTGATRIDTIARSNFTLLADISAVREAIGRDTIIDARSREEFDGATLRSTDADTTCLVPACTATFSGRIASAHHLPWTRVLGEDGHFASRAAIDEALLPLDAESTAYVYDLDGRESAIVTFAMLAIAGRPARWYAASFIEWGALNASHPNGALRALTEDSPWRTEALTEAQQHWADDDRGVRPLIFDAAAAATDLVQKTDARYKQKPPPLPAVGAVGGGC